MVILQVDKEIILDGNMIYFGLKEANHLFKMELTVNTLCNIMVRLVIGYS